jgi:DNA repair exonuclease SbcCD ATPase subunit
MTIAKLKDQLGRLSKGKSAGPPAPDPRDDAIAKLERAITEEREHSATLRKTIDELRFKSETLDRSYSKQLDDARKRCEAAERELEQQKAQVAELSGTDKNATQQLSEARADLKRVTSERDRLRKALSALGSAPTKPFTQDAGNREPEADAMSIDELLEDAIWASEQKRINQQRGGNDSRLPDADKSPTEEMLSPELIIANKADADTGR